MKYKDLANIDFTKVVPNIVCSLCGAPVGSDDKFCRQCGRALTRKPGVIPMATIISVLDGYYGKHGDAAKAEGRVNASATDICIKGQLTVRDCMKIIGTLRDAISEIKRVAAEKGDYYHCCQDEDNFEEREKVSKSFQRIAEICIKALDNWKTDLVWAGDINPGTDSVSTKPTKEVATLCPYGDHRPESCGHCTKNGACDMTVLTSYPPQYNMCPYRGSGFIFCKDA